MYDRLPKRVMLRNADRIVDLDMTFGHLVFNDHGQTISGTLNLCIPLAHLIKAGLVLAVVDSFDSVNDEAVADVERYCRIATNRLQAAHGDGWWTKDAERLNLP